MPQVIVKIGTKTLVPALIVSALSNGVLRAIVASRLGEDDSEGTLTLDEVALEFRHPRSDDENMDELEILIQANETSHRLAHRQLIEQAIKRDAEDHLPAGLEFGVWLRLSAGSYSRGIGRKHIIA